MIAALAIPCVAAPAAANDWQLTVAPYIWAVAFNGSVTAAGNKADVDASFGDIVDKSDSMLAFNADLELHNGRFGFMLGPSYMNVGVDNLRDGTPTEADATAGLLFVDAAAVVRVIDWGMESLVHGQPTSVTFDAYGGVRYTRLDLEIDFDAGGSPSEDKDWWDPIIGGDTIVDLTSRWFLHFRGDVGGFGAGSNFSALGLASLGYRFSLFGRDAAVAAGYRAIFQDYDEDSGAERFEWDMTIHGPTLGLVTHWG
jgi:hypothetical protein